MIVRTDSSYSKWYKVPYLLLDKLEDVRKSCEAERNDEDNCSNLRWDVSIQDISVWVIESGMAVRIGHDGFFLDLGRKKVWRFVD